MVVGPGCAIGHARASRRRSSKVERFKNGAEFLIVLRNLEDRPLSATNHSFTLTLDGTALKDQRKNEFYFVFDATNPDRDGIGGAVPDISVEK